MTITAIIAALIFFFLLMLGFVLFRYDPLYRYEPVTEEELLLLTLVEDQFYPDLLTYMRTLEMSPELQDYLKDKKDVLESISYFMMTQAAKSEQEKRERLERDRMRSKDESQLSHNERMILRRLRAWSK